MLYVTSPEEARDNINQLMKVLYLKTKLSELNIS